MVVARQVLPDLAAKVGATCVQCSSGAGGPAGGSALERVAAALKV